MAAPRRSRTPWLGSSIAWTCLGLGLCVASASAAETTLHVSRLGRDTWSGRLATPAADQSDGPFASLVRARDAARALRRGGKLAGPITIVVHAGRHELAEPLRLTPEDSGTAESPTIVTAAPGDEGKVILSGGRAVAGWKPTLGPRGEWIAEPPALRDGRKPRQISVDGDWRDRPRLPATGTYTMAGLAGADPKARYDTPADRFEYAPGQIDPAWNNLGEVEVVVLHFWVDSHFRIASVDPASRVARLDRKSRRKFTDDYTQGPARYFLLNVAEALAPGQFLADPARGTLQYLPLPGESRERTTVVFPALERVLEIEGDPRAGRLVEHVSFRGLTFSDTTYEPGPRDAVDGQAASEVTAAIRMTGARDVALEGCVLTNLGGYGIDVAEGCRDIRIVGNLLTRLGAGGVRISGANASQPEAERTSAVAVEDNRLLDLGRSFHSGVGVLLRHASGCSVRHNEVGELDYTAISVGWVWGYAPSVSRDNAIEFNHIHHVGRGLLSDMGGVYTLGVSPGTVVRNNHIHDIQAHGYGGWGLYTDEGSTGILLEDNVVYRTTHGGFHQHYGRDNIVRNNVFALARDEQLARSRNEPHRSFTFERNILAYRTGVLFGHNWSGGPERVELDRNVYWNLTGKAPEFPGGSLETWRGRGHDSRSIVADPRFMDLEHDDFRLRPDSPALGLGFRPIDLSRVGPRRPPPSARSARD